jgi:hypothetical protein
VTEDDAVKAFLVAVNGQRVCLAGIGSNGVMDVSVQWKGGKRLDNGSLNDCLKLRVGGLDTTSREFVHWETPAIGTGDEITIKVVESETVDQEYTRYIPPDEPKRPSTT